VTTPPTPAICATDAAHVAERISTPWLRIRKPDAWRRSRCPAANGCPRPQERTTPASSRRPYPEVFAPAGTPRDVVARINTEMQRVFKLPEVVDKLKGLGLEPWISTPEELASYQAAEITKWTKVAKESGAKAD
jgi:hypothetical protein